MKHFCVLPFLQVNNELDGVMRPCCWNAETFGDTRVDGIRETWNSRGWRELRADMVRGGRPASCRECLDREALGLESPRLAFNRIHQHLVDLQQLDRTTGELRAPPRFLALRLSPACALACRMCFPTVSSSVHRIWDAELEAITGCSRGELRECFPDPSRLLAEVEALGPSLQQVYISGGEPLLHPLVLQVLRRLEPWSEQVRIHLATSLVTLERLASTILEEFLSFRKCTMTVSVDGFPALHGYIRPGLPIASFLENLERVRGHAHVQLDVNIAIQALNILYLPETIDFLLRAVRPAFIASSLVQSPGFEYTDARTLPGALKQVLTRKLTDFSSTLVPELYPEVAPAIVADARRMLLDASRFATSRDLHTPEQWARFSSYHRKLDRVHHTSLRDACPELAAYLS